MSDRIIFAEPLLRLAAEYREDAERNRREWKDDQKAAHFDRIAERIEAAVEEGASREWVDVTAAAELLRLHPETVRIRCRRELGPSGRAKKVGGEWRVHVSAVAA